MAIIAPLAVALVHRDDPAPASAGTGLQAPVIKALQQQASSFKQQTAAASAAATAAASSVDDTTAAAAEPTEDAAPGAAALPVEEVLADLDSAMDALPDWKRQMILRKRDEVLEKEAEVRRRSQELERREAEAQARVQRLLDKEAAVNLELASKKKRMSALEMAAESAKMLQEQQALQQAEFEARRKEREARDAVEWAARDAANEEHQARLAELLYEPATEDVEEDDVDAVAADAVSPEGSPRRVSPSRFKKGVGRRRPGSVKKLADVSGPALQCGWACASRGRAGGHCRVVGCACCPGSPWLLSFVWHRLLALKHGAAAR